MLDFTNQEEKEFTKEDFHKLYIHHLEEGKKLKEELKQLKKRKPIMDIKFSADDKYFEKAVELKEKIIKVN